MNHNLLLFCAPTWPSHHVIENHLREDEDEVNFVKQISPYTKINLTVAQVVEGHLHSCSRVA